MSDTDEDRESRPEVPPTGSAYHAIRVRKEDHQALLNIRKAVAELGAEGLPEPLASIYTRSLDRADHKPRGVIGLSVCVEMAVALLANRLDLNPQSLYDWKNGSPEISEVPGTSPSPGKEDLGQDHSAGSKQT